MRIEEFQKDLVYPSQLLKEPKKYYAHSKVEGLKNVENETLEEHTRRAVERFTIIWKEKNLDVFIEKIEKVFLNEMSKEAILLFRKLQYNMVAFHDLGKINPSFQKLRMKNLNFKNSTKVNICVGSTHSLISAFLYLEYFMNQTKELVKEERKLLRLFVCIHAYIISRHHGVLENILDFMNSFKNNERYEELFEVLKQEYSKYFLDEGKFFQKSSSLKIVPNSIHIFPKEKEKAIMLYAYEKMMYSLLVASDYYATTQFQNSYDVSSFGNVRQIEHILNKYNANEVVLKIREYEKKIKLSEQEKGNRLKETSDINTLRNEIFLEAEMNLKNQLKENVFYLEAPTGSGKSNIALNLSLKLIENNASLGKIWYIYPFNTLVEQNVKNMQTIFEQEEDILNQIHVVNSLTPIDEQLALNTKISRQKKEAMQEEFSNEYYVKQLLDQQFFHYPITISTHVTLFEIMFGNQKDSALGFYQLMNSVIILDEIQSYKNDIWTEIIFFLKTYAKILNLRIIIMSATLPDLDLLSEEDIKAVHLIQNPNIYLTHPIFKNRVQVHYDFLDQDMSLEEEQELLMKSIMNDYFLGNHVLVEFITKKTANEFYKKIKEAFYGENIQLMTGDDTSIYRNKVLQEIEVLKKETKYLLIATQVIEAGVDLKNMDIGYKNISTLDSEEQFMGRINRNKSGIGNVYFFQINEAKTVYKNDIRIEKELTLHNPNMRKCLEEKQFMEFYKKVFDRIKEKNDSYDMSKNIDEFFLKVGRLDVLNVRKRMQLIDDKQKTITVYLSQTIEDLEGEVLEGKKIWERYIVLLEDKDIPFAEWKVKMSRVKAKMRYFMYEVNNVNSFTYDEKVGDIFYIENGEDYFEDGKFDRKKIANESQVFI